VARFDYDSIIPKTKAVVGFIEEVKEELTRFAQMPTEELTNPEREAITQLCIALVMIHRVMPNLQEMSEEMETEVRRNLFDGAFPGWADTTIMH